MLYAMTSPLCARSHGGGDQDIGGRSAPKVRDAWAWAPVYQAGQVEIVLAPHRLHRSRWPASGTVVVSGKLSTLTSPRRGCRLRHVAVTMRTPFKRMLARVIGGPGGARMGQRCASAINASIRTRSAFSAPALEDRARGLWLVDQAAVDADVHPFGRSRAACHAASTRRLRRIARMLKL